MGERVQGLTAGEWYDRWKRDMADAREAWFRMRSERDGHAARADRYEQTIRRLKDVDPPGKGFGAEIAKRATIKDHREAAGG